MSRAAYVLLPFAVVFGLWSEWVRYGIEDPGSSIPDLLTGVTILGAGTLAWSRRPTSRVGLLLVVTGVCWFAGNLAIAFGSATGVIPLAGAALADALVASHRAPFAHALVSYPDGRSVTALEKVAVGAAYASVVVASVWRVGSAGLIVGLIVAAVAWRSYRRAVGPRRRSKLTALRAASGVAAALVAGLVLRRVLSPGVASEAALLLYELALGASAVFLAARLVRPTSEEASVADFVVELGEARSATLRDALADVLGDPSLQVGYRIGLHDSYVDAEGRSVNLPDAATGRAITRIERDGQEVAVLVHDPAVLDEPALLDAVVSAARLASRNAALQVEVRGQLGELRASRRRLVGAGDAERQRLAQRLNSGALVRLDGLGDLLGSAAGDADPSVESSQRVERARAQAARSVDELRELAQGLHPSELREGGLGPALRGLVLQGHPPVQLDVPEGRFPIEIEAAVYFLCAEGLANAAKHAGATVVHVGVRPVAMGVSVEVIDDGVGGADLEGGGGLRGLVDRIEALGGRLTVDSPASGGTRLTAEIPLADEG